MLFLFGFWTCPFNALLFLTGVHETGANSDGFNPPGWLAALIILLVGMPLFRWLVKLVDSQLKDLSKDDA